MAAEQSLFPRAMSLAVHELRTPVTVVLGYLRMLLREQGGPISEKQRKMLQEAEHSCSRLAALVAEMSDLGKLEARELALAQQEFDFAALVTELASDMQEGRDRGVTLEIRGCETAIPVKGDRARLGAAIKALLFATLRERGEPGVIVSECSVESGSPGSVVVAIGEASRLPALRQPAAADAGPAFDEWRGGLGFALPLARRVIEAHGGKLWSAGDGRPGGGVAFRLPLRA